MTHCFAYLNSLRQLGHRITPQREMIIEALAHGDGHMSVEQIYSILQTRTKAINLATVYRTLDLLVDRKLATRTYAWDGTAVYATWQHGPHVHLVCRICGTVCDAEQEVVAALEARLEKQYQFDCDLQHTTIFGVCKECQTAPPIST